MKSQWKINQEKIKAEKREWMWAIIIGSIAMILLVIIADYSLKRIGA